MDTSQVLSLVKARLGITSTVRDEYLTYIVEGVIEQLDDEQGITLVSDNANHLMFVVDLSTWRYQNKDAAGGMPRHLQYRLHNLMIRNGGGTSDV